MNTKNISIALIITGALLYATSGNLFSLTPDGWRVIFYKSGQIALVLGGLLALYHGATIIADQLRERLRNDAKDVVESNDATRAVLSDLSTEIAEAAGAAEALGQQRLDLAIGAAHIAGGTALSAELQKQIYDLLARLTKIAGSKNDQRYVSTAEELRSRLERLMMTRDGVAGPGLIMKAQEFLAVHQTACDELATFERLQAAAAEGQKAHANALAALNAFAA